jgi:hypothetical protein
VPVAGRRADAEDRRNGAEDRVRQGRGQGGKSGLTWLDPFAERFAQLDWVLDHEADLDADFLAIYRIDLEQDEITGPRYFALAHRLPAYSGVMASRMEAQRDQQDQGATRSTSAPQQAASSGGVKEVSLTAFRVQFPGLVSMGGGG